MIAPSPSPTAKPTAKPTAPWTLLLGVLLLGTTGGAGLAQDSDEFYAIARGDYGRRPAASQAARGFSFPGASLFGGGRQRDVPEITVRPTTPDQANAARATNERQGRTDSGENVSGPRAFCVRTCDGFFFPVGPAMSGSGRQAQQMTCNRLCPGSEVALYTIGRQGSIEEAVGPRGQTYAALRTAFRFRQAVDRACTCQGSATNGLARLPITHDFTLRAGDVVVTDEGVRVFRGGARFPYGNQDFVAAASYGRLPADVRRRVAEIQAGIQARDSGTAAPVARTGRLGALVRPVEQPPAATPVPVQEPVASAAGPVRILDVTRRASASTLQ